MQHAAVPIGSGTRAFEEVNLLTWLIGPLVQVSSTSTQSATGWTDCGASHTHSTWVLWRMGTPWRILRMHYIEA